VLDIGVGQAPGGLGEAAPGRPAPGSPDELIRDEAPVAGEAPDG
jgi:hypothetical protein